MTNLEVISAVLVFVAFGYGALWSFRHPADTHRTLWFRYCIYGFFGYLFFGGLLGALAIGVPYPSGPMVFFFGYVPYAWVLAGRRTKRRI